MRLQPVLVWLVSTYIFIFVSTIKKGTVDSGHLCISGYNEVIMMRVLSDDEIKDAYKILNGEYDNEPHEGGSTENWPTNDIIQSLKEKGSVVR